MEGAGLPGKQSNRGVRPIVIPSLKSSALLTHTQALEQKNNPNGQRRCCALCLAPLSQSPPATPAAQSLRKARDRMLDHPPRPIPAVASSKVSWPFPLGKQSLGEPTCTATITGRSPKHLRPKQERRAKKEPKKKSALRWNRR